MGVRFACHNCGKRLNIKNDLAGKRGKCPQCNERFRIPLSDQEYSEPLDDDSDQPAEPPIEPTSAPQSSAERNSGAAQQSSQPLKSSHRVAASTEPADEVVASWEHPPQSSASSPQSPASTSAESPRPQQAGGKAADAGTSVPNASSSNTSSAPPSENTADSEYNPLTEEGVMWYVRPPAGGRYGPADGPTILSWIGEGRVTPDTLLWREPWSQWKECRDIVPMPDEPAKPQPTGTPSVAQPQAISGSPAAVSTTKATGGSSSPYDPDSYLGAKKRQKAKRRATLIAVLVAVSFVLIVALIVAMLWPPADDSENSAKLESSPAFQHLAG